MGEVYKMVAIKSDTKDMLDRRLKSLRVSSGKKAVTYDTLIRDLLGLKQAVTVTLPKGAKSGTTYTIQNNTDETIAITEVKD